MRVSELTTKMNIQKWSKLIEECKNSGKSVRSWCLQNDINHSQYFYWQRKICKEITKSCDKKEVATVDKMAVENTIFAEVRLSEEPVYVETINDVAISMYVNNNPIQIYNNASEDILRRTLRVLKDL